MKYTIIPVILLAAFIFAGPAGGRHASAQEKKFILPEIPSDLRATDQRRKWLILNYWQHYDFTDTALVKSVETEQAFSDFLSLFDEADEKTVCRGIRNMMDAASGDPAVYSGMLEIADIYLYHYDSPFRDDEKYIHFLRHALKSRCLDSSRKILPAEQLDMALKNRKGSRAANFTMTTGSGKNIDLKDIKAEMTILFFFDPECRDCEMTRILLSTSPVIKEKTADGSLKILAVYPEDINGKWISKTGKMPECWIKAYDGSGKILENELYDLGAYPALYPLDRKQRVLLKETDVANIEFYLENC